VQENGEFLSVGIDIGTTTTQIIFSRMIVQNTTSSFCIPEMKITEKTIIHKSKIHFTPFATPEKIDLQKLKNILVEEYQKAGICQAEIATGAAIITGETACKENAEEVLQVLSGFAGDFVVAVAGPDLEGILAGYGAGAAEAAKNAATRVINFDIGGGTTNAAVFLEGEAVDSFALDIGGRLIKMDHTGNITYISPQIKRLLSSLSLDFNVGSRPKLADLTLLTDTFAQILMQIYDNQELCQTAAELFIGHLPKGISAELLMFSGGVSEYIYNQCAVNTLEEVCQFGDIGPLFGCSIRKAAQNAKLLTPKEKIRATVIGAGSHLITISGSTIVFDDAVLPVKNVPIIRLSCQQDINDIYTAICEKKRFYPDINTAIAFAGPKSPSYA
jgi:ethanolamine utilization protein EutA